MYKASADAVYCSASFATVKRMADEAIPVIGHVGLIPSRATWTGGFRAVGKTASSAMGLFRAVKQYEAAGAFGVEIEVVPIEVAKAISERTSLFMLSMGAGTGCDAQYLFAGTSWSESRPHASAFQGLSKLRGGIRPPPGGEDRSFSSMSRTSIPEPIRKKTHSAHRPERTARLPQAGGRPPGKVAPQGRHRGVTDDVGRIASSLIAPAASWAGGSRRHDSRVNGENFWADPAI